MEKLIRGLAIAIVVALLIGGAAIALGLRYNGTRSWPLGLYLASNKSSHRGDLVIVFLPLSPVLSMGRDRGYMNVAYSPTAHLLKRLAAVAGDRVSINSLGVDVNGIRLANSAPMNRDGAGRPLVPYPLKDYILRAGEVLLMSDYNPASFDSRYFGPMQATAIESVVRPLLTF